MSAFVIHGVPLSTYVRIVRLVCEEKGVPYTLVPRRPHEPVTPAHPFGKIPVAVHDGKALCESTAIARYVDRVFPGPALQPADPWAAALCDQAMSFVCDNLQRSIVLGLALPRLGIVPADEAAIAANLPVIDAHVGTFEAMLDGRDHLVGDTLTLADLFLLPFLDTLRGLPEGSAIVAGKPGITAWLARMEARPSYAAIKPAPSTGA